MDATDSQILGNPIWQSNHGTSTTPTDDLDFRATWC